MSPGHVPITHSLGTALRHLRQADGPRLLWVDAVCINQQDDVERNAQVLRMGDIYSLAQRVVVWLGEASDDSALALKTMQYLGRQIEISQGGWQHRPPDAQESQWIDQDYKLPYSADEWASLTALMGRAWFRRVWVLQEVSVANPNAVVQCGPDSISYYHFRRAVIGLRMRNGAPDALIERIEEKAILSYGMESKTVCDLISIAREHASTLPHDKIYGLLWTEAPCDHPASLPTRVRPRFQGSVSRA